MSYLFLLNFQTNYIQGVYNDHIILDISSILRQIIIQSIIIILFISDQQISIHSNEASFDSWARTALTLRCFILESSRINYN